MFRAPAHRVAHGPVDGGSCGPGRVWWLALALCAVASASPFFVTYRMPMSDLPQHAAQITLWKHYDESCYHFRQLYREDWFTPYLLGYGIARVFAAVLSVNNALKLTVYVAMLALVLACRMVIDRARADPLLALLGFPLAFGFSFYLGFINFVVALPLGVAFIVLAYDYSSRQTFRRAAVLTGTGLLLLAAHALMFVVCLVIAGALHLTLWRAPKRMLLTALPYIVPLPFAALWVATIRAQEKQTAIPPWWRETIARPLWFFTHLLAADWDPAAIVFALLFISVALLFGVKLTRDPRRWIPFVVCAAGYLAAPFAAFGNALLFQRFAVLTAVFALLLLDRGRPLVGRAVAHGLLCTTVIVWSAILAARFHKFDADASDFDRVVDSVPTNQRLLFLNAVPQSDALPGVPFLHFAAYYQERRGGTIGVSFASHFPELIRYRPGADPMTSLGLEWEPRVFNWHSNDSRFDFFLVRSAVEMHDLVFRDATEPVELIEHHGMWRLYAKRSAARQSACPPFEPDDKEARSR